MSRPSYEALLDEAKALEANEDQKETYGNFDRSHTFSPPPKRSSNVRSYLRAVVIGLGALALLSAFVGSFATYRGASLGTSVGRIEFKPALDYNKRAILVEKRNHRNLIPLLHDFLVKVPAEWPFQVWCGVENDGVMRKNKLLAPFIESGKLNLTLLPDEDDLYDGNTLSKFLTAPWLWEQLAPAEHIFFFQLDSVICGKSRNDLNDFLGLDVVPGGYSWLGAPWNELGYPAVPFWGGNGGFSLRRRSAMLNMTLTHQWDGNPEDVWFSRKLADTNGLWPIGTQHASMHFAHETIPEAARRFDWPFRPYGIHVGSNWGTCVFERWDDIRKLMDYCPELAMIAPPHCLR